QCIRDCQLLDREYGIAEHQVPLFRLTLFHIGPQKFHLLWSMHHTILDAWSIVLLLNELFARYQMLIEGREPVLPASRPYRDYIAWLQEQDQHQAEAFWREELRGIHAATPLPFFQPHLTSWGAKEVTHGQQKGQLSREVSQQLQRVARELHITVNTLFQASWAYVLSRYSGQQEVLFGITVAGREAELVGSESLVGLCINTLPVRIRIPQNEIIRNWLQEVHENLVAVLQYAYYPLVQIQGASEIPPNLPLFQCIFVFENHPVERKPSGSLRVF